MASCSRGSADCGNKLGFLEGTIALALKHPELGGKVREIIKSLLG
jgi:UTP-glucose-1-phosphate uridylyltransferase